MGLKIFGFKKILGSKNFWVQKIFGFKKLLGQNKFWSKKILDQKIFGSKKNGKKKSKVFWVIKILGQKIFWVKNFWAKKIGQKDLDPKQVGLTQG